MCVSPALFREAADARDWRMSCFRVCHSCDSDMDPDAFLSSKLFLVRTRENRFRFAAMLFAVFGESWGVACPWRESSSDPTHSRERDENIRQRNGMELGLRDESNTDSK